MLRLFTVNHWVVDDDWLDAGPTIALLPRVSEYLSLIMTLIFAFGLVFQLPVVSSLLVRSGIVSAAGLASKRKYAIVIAFIVAAVITPPDPLSQIGVGGHQDPANDVGMSVQIFGGRMHDNVGPQAQRLLAEGRGEGVVDAEDDVGDGAALGEHEAVRHLAGVAGRDDRPLAHDAGPARPATQPRPGHVHSAVIPVGRSPPVHAMRSRTSSDCLRSRISWASSVRPWAMARA